MKKKRILGMFGFATILVAVAFNVNIVLKDMPNVSLGDLTLSNIISLAQNESGLICSVCGGNLNEGDCTCGGGPTCDYASCWGKQCHYPAGNVFCPCRADGTPWSYC